MAEMPLATNGHSPESPLHAAPRRVLQVFSDLANRMLLAARQGWEGGDPRNIPTTLGYKPSLTFADYKGAYKRRDLAHRLVRAYPEATWSQHPVVQEDDQDTIQTPFEAAWEALQARLTIFDRLERLDLLANLGRYSVLLIGLRDQSQLDDAAQAVRGPDDVLFLTAYSEEFAVIDTIDQDASSARFGLPQLYRINIGRSSTRTQYLRVHHSRVVHLAEDLLDDEVYGTPRLEPVFDKLYDMLKVVGGAGELFWRDAKRRLALQVRDTFDMTEEDKKTLLDEAEEFMFQLKDFITVHGVDVNNLSGHIASPRDHYDVLLDVIAGATGIPKRKLTGSERGELASVQDDANWLERVTRRQQQFAEPRAVRALIDRLLLLGALPPPAQPYMVRWPNLLALSEKDQAAVAKDWATAISQYASQDTAELIVPPQEFRDRYLGLPPESDYASPERLEPTPEEL